MRPERSDRAEPRDGVRSQPLCERVADLQRASALLGEALHSLGVPESDLSAWHIRGAARALAAATAGYRKTALDIVADAPEEGRGDEPIVVRDVPFASLCREHLLPFHGCALIAYLPGERAVGPSGIRPLVNVFAHRLQSQRRLTDQVAHALHDTLGVRGVMVRLEARHLCPDITGSVLTQAYLGDFRRPLWRDRLESMPVGG